MTCEAFDVVAVPFPFSDSGQTKRRPALVLSSSKTFGAQSGHSVLAMITSAHNSSWPLDVRIFDMKAAGLPVDSLVRMKIFTLDNRFVLKKIGRLHLMDRNSVLQNLGKLLGRAAVPSSN